MSDAVRCPESDWCAIVYPYLPGKVLLQLDNEWSVMQGQVVLDVAAVDSLIAALQDNLRPTFEQTLARTARRALPTGPCPACGKPLEIRCHVGCEKAP